MVRAKKDPDEQPTEPIGKNERNRQIVKQWLTWLGRGQKKKREFNETAEKVDKYFSADHDHLYQDPGLREWVNLSGAAATTVNLAFQIRGWLGPNLYHRNPTRTVTVRRKDPILRAMARVIEAYLNYTPNECGLQNESRKAIDESLLAGRGVLYTGVDDETGLVTSWSVSVDDVIVDPDARCLKEALWIAFRRVMPLQRAKREYPDSRGLKANMKHRSAVREEGEQDDDRADDEDGPGTNELVEVWEVYSKIGLNWKGEGVPDEFANFDDSKEFVKIVVAEDFERPLQIGDWEIPLYLDRDWPFTFLDLTPTRNELWPTSLFGAAIHHQRAVDILATLELHLAKIHAREIYFVKAIDKDRVQQIVSGGLTEVVEIGGKDPQPLRDLLHRFDTGQISPEIGNLREWHLHMFAEVTGVLPILKGQGFDVQARSATEADIRDKNARSRIQDMSERVEDWQTEAARHEGIGVRLSLDADEVEAVVGGPGELDLGFCLSVRVLGSELPVKAPKARKDGDGKEPIGSLEGLFKLVGLDSFATYFANEQDAAMAAEALTQIATAGLLPVVPELPINYRPVTVQDVWRDTSGMGPKEIARELAYRIESGSTRRPDHNKKITQAEQVMNTVGTASLQLGDFATYNAALDLLYDGLETPTDKRVYLQPPPPMPMTQETTGGPEGMPMEAAMGDGMGMGMGAPQGLTQAPVQIEPQAAGSSM